MTADVDKDGSGAIDLDELVHMMTGKIGERYTMEELMNAFQILDHDNNVSPLYFCSTFSEPSCLNVDALFLYFSIESRERYLLVISEAYMRNWMRAS